MKITRFATVFLAAASTFSASVFALDQGPRFVQDRLDELVAHHTEASRHIAASKHAHADTAKDQQAK